jgi:hypothetical protein
MSDPGRRKMVGKVKSFSFPTSSSSSFSTTDPYSFSQLLYMLWSAETSSWCLAFNTLLSKNDSKMEEDDSNTGDENIYTRMKVMNTRRIRPINRLQHRRWWQR